MMKRSKWVCALLAVLLPLLCCSLQGQTEKTSANPLPVVGDLKHPELDVGCWLKFRNTAENHEQYIFGSTPDKVMMNLDGQDTSLTTVSDPAADDVQEYTVGTVRVTVRYGIGKPNDAGNSYSRATITLTKNGKSRVIQAKGQCGC